MFSADDSDFKKHMLLIMVVLLELLSLGIILTATNNALHTVTNYLKLDYPLSLDNISETALTRGMAAFIFFRSWYHYAAIDQIDNAYKENRVLIQKVRNAITHTVVFVVIYILSDYNAFIRLINFVSEILPQ